MGADRVVLARNMALALLALALAPAAARAQGRPTWVDRPPAHTAEKLYFVEAATGAKSAVLARDLAMRKAMAAVQAYFGQSVKSEMVSEEYERDQQYHYTIRAAIKLEGVDVQLNGVRVEETWMREPGDGKTDWDCWMLVSYPRAEYDTAIKKMHEAFVARGTRALELFREGKALVDGGRPEEALARLAQAGETLKTVRNVVELPDPVVRNSDVLGTEIEAAVKAAQELKTRARRTVAVKILVTADGKPLAGGLADEVRSDAVGMVGRHELAAAAGAPGDAEALKVMAGDAALAGRIGASLASWYLLIGWIDAKFTSEVYGQFFAEATGSAVLVDALTGRAIVAKDLGRVKAGHVTRADACSKAASGLRKPLSAALDEMLDAVRASGGGGR
jgi:hypothetical protein